MTPQTKLPLGVLASSTETGPTEGRVDSSKLLAWADSAAGEGVQVNPRELGLSGDGCNIVPLFAGGVVLT